MIYLNVFLITLIIVFIIDLSGFIEEVEVMLSKWLKIKAVIPKPFSCSLCLTWWINLFYVLFSGNISLLLVAYIALNAFLTPLFYDSLVIIRETLQGIILRLPKP